MVTRTACVWRRLLLPTATVILKQCPIGPIDGSVDARLSLGLAVNFGLHNVISFAHDALCVLGAALAALNSLGLVPQPVATAMAEASRWALLIAMAAIGMKASLGTVMQVGGTAILLITVETAVLAKIFVAAL